MDQDQQSGNGVDHSHDKVFFETFLGVLGVLFGITFIIFFVANVIGDTAADDGIEPVRIEQVRQRVEPVGTVVTDAAALQKVSTAAPAAKRSAKEIVNGVCAGCHATGVLDAPKLGDKAAWKAHLDEDGIDHLYSAAINGEAQMPPRGGDASLTDDEVKAAVDYILKDAGL